jgi:cyclomaltodextrinase / maltogenic alpha-amylase / neopullulanase
MGKQTTITREAIFHMPKSNYAYGYDKETLHIRVRTKKGEVDSVTLRAGDQYVWENGGANGGNLNASGSNWSSAENMKMIKEVETEYFDYWFVDYKPKYKRTRYAFIIENEDEKLLYTERRIFDISEEGLKKNEKMLSNPGVFFNFPYLNGIDVAETPSWAKDTVWYQIFPDRFAKGDNSINKGQLEVWGEEPTQAGFMGGDLQGVIDRLDYIQELGVNGIYFCPIFTAKSNHRYDTIDYMEIDPRLGTKETFKRLVEEAHARGIKIMLDAVFNHSGFFFKQWQDVLKNEEKSIYKDWFHINKFPVKECLMGETIDEKKLSYETFGTVFSMPKLNTENPEVKEYLLEVGRYWVREFDIDAWRIDVANEVDHVFWREFRKEVRSIKPDAYILGEIWHNSLPWLMGDQFDAVMNYPLTDAINGFFCENKLHAEEFKYMVNETAVSYSRQVNEANFNLLDSHDTTRILSIANGHKNKVKLAYLFMLAQPGAPCIYYGDEIGMDSGLGGESKSNRSCMIWEEEKQDRDLFDFVKRLLQLRKEKPEFRIANLEWLESDSEAGVVAFRKGDVVFIINNSDNTACYALPEELQNKNAYELFSDASISLEETIELKPYGFIILK